MSGDGDPLIVLHGAYMNSPSMGAIIPKLAESHEVYALNCRATAARPTSTDPSPIPTSRTTWRSSWTRWASRRADVFGHASPSCRRRRTAVITQPDLLHALIEPFLKGETAKGMFE